MDIQGILDRIATRSHELGLSEAEVSKRVKSRDMIRNWRRALSEGRQIEMRQSSLEGLAAALDVSLAWLTGEDKVKNSFQRPKAKGFYEAAAPFQFKNDNENVQIDIARMFRDKATMPATFQLFGSLPSFGFLHGDILIVDLARLPKPSEITLVTIADDTLATTTTRVLRYLPPYLMPSEPSNYDPILRLDQGNVTVRYPVIGCIRGPK